MLDGVDWIERVRSSNENYKGFIPAMRATDWASIAHFWQADAGNILAYKYLIKVFEKYNDIENAKKAHDKYGAEASADEVFNLLKRKYPTL